MPALLTRTRTSFGTSNVEGSVTSSRLTLSRPSASASMPAPAAVSRMVATVSKPRLASSSAMARPIPRLAPVTNALP